MDAEILFNAVLSTGLGAVALALIMYIRMKGRSKRFSRMFIIVMGELAMAAFLSAAMLFSNDEGTSLLLAKVFGFFYVMIYASFLYLSMILVKGDISKTTLTTYLFFLMFVIVALVSGIFMEVKESDGVYLPSGAGLTLLVSTAAALAITTTAWLISNIKLERKENREQSLILIIAIISPLGFESFVASLRYIGVEMSAIVHPVEMIGFVVAMTYAALRYQLNLFKSSNEMKIRTASICATPMDCQGKSYIVEAQDNGMAYSILIEELGKGAEGLVVSREHPDRVHERCGLEETRSIWLTDIPGPNYIDPMNISIIHRTVSEFQETIKRPIVLIDGLDVLILNNKVEKVLQMLFDLRDEFIASEGTFILSLDPRTLETKVLVMLEKDFQVLHDMERTTN